MSNSTKLKIKSEDSINPNTYGRELYAGWYDRFMEKVYSHAKAANHSIAIYTIVENIYSSYGAKKTQQRNNKTIVTYLEFPNEDQKLAFLLTWS